jgi:uncharacterized surface protein with fasciclin (FAS1) repeats
MQHRGRHTRPALEAIWRVPGEGLVFRHMVRELFVFDPNRLELTHLWYAGDGCGIDDIHVVTDSDDMFMLSFAPLLKDIPVYICDHAVTPLDLARQSLHPLNDTPLTSAFARHPIRLHYGAMTEARWGRRVRASHGFVDQAVMMRECLRIWRAIHEHGGCTVASRLISVALQATRLARQWPHDGPVTVFVPSDAAVGRCAPDAIERLVPGAAAARLIATILHHVTPALDGPSDRGPASVRTLAGVDRRRTVQADATFIDDTKVVATIDVPPHRVLVIDGWLAPL